MNKIPLFFIVFFCFAIAFLLSESNVKNEQAQLPEKQPVPEKYSLLFEKNLLGEEFLSPRSDDGVRAVRVIDFNSEEKKKAIVVAGKKLYFFDSNGVQLQIPSWDFNYDIQQMKVGQFSKNGKNNGVVVATRICGPTFEIFDSSGRHLSTITNDRDLHVLTFLLKDIDKDGIDEIITAGKCFHTENNGKEWNLFWQRTEFIEQWDENELVNFWLGKDFGTGNSFCAEFREKILLVSQNGIVFSEIQIPEMQGIHNWNSFFSPFAIGDFSGNGKKTSIVISGGNKKNLYIIESNGTIKKTIPLSNDSNAFFASIITTGKITENSEKEAIIVGGSRGIIAIDPEGKKLWAHYQEDKESPLETATHLFISDLFGDGKKEIIAALGKKIFVFSSEGEIINELQVNGYLKGLSWGSENPAMDIADINNDGKQEIIAITTKGTLYAFAAS